jgi:hypothetical protein
VASLNVFDPYVNLMKNQIIQKFQSFEILKKRVAKQNTQFFQTFEKRDVQWVQNA